MNKPYIFGIGIVMGLAEVVPGVSGGTIAFVGGIFERLIHAVKEVDVVALRLLFKGEFSAFAKKIDFFFLVFVLVGMGLGLVLGVFGVTYLLEHHPIEIWSFFFGLILASSIYLGAKIPHWNMKIILSILIGAGLAYFITIQAPATGKDAYWAYLLSGMIAISATILPGISGSFILLLLGMYPLVLGQAHSFLSDMDMNAFSKLAVFGIGTLVGISGFARILTWLFDHYEYTTYAVLTGFVFGSLNKIWPWKRPLLGQDASGHLLDLTVTEFDSTQIEVIREENLSPFHAAITEAHLGMATIMCLLGIALIFVLSGIERKIVK